MKTRNNFLRRTCSCLVMLMMVLSFFVNFNVFADKVNDNTKTFTGDGFEVVFQIVNQWNNSYSGNITVKNVGDKTIENWAIKFSMDSEITGIWNANIADKAGSEYVITNAGWNQNIAPNSEVSFGFTADFTDGISMPEEFLKLGAEVNVPREKYSIDCKVLNQWGNSYNGEVTITNVSDEAIEDWELFFDSNSEITSIWNAEKELLTGTKYHIKNCVYNSGIKPGQSVTFGYQATTQEDEITSPTNILLAQYEATADVRSMYEVDVDGDGLPDYYERQYGTDPYLEDTDGNGIKDGDEKYHTVISSEDDKDSPSNVAVTVEMDAEGKQLNTMDVVKIPESDPMLSSDIPGYVGNAYELKIDGEFNTAKVTFTVKSEPDSNYKPCLYYFNEEEQWLRKVPDQQVVGNTLSATVDKFAKYIVLNEIDFNKVWEEQIRIPSEEGFDRIDLSLVIDSSGSMTSNDKNNLRLKVAKEMVDKLSDKDRVSIIKFASPCQLILPFSADKNLVKDKIDLIGRTGDTAMHGAINLSNSLFSSYSNEKGVYKLMVVLTDGQATDSKPKKEQLVQDAVNNGVVIYTVGLGNNIDTKELEYIARNTNGVYYKAAEAEALSAVFSTITQENIDFITDTDGDGISDYFEENLHRLFNGVQVALDKNNPDTDGDGLLDGEEVSVTVADDNIVYFRMKSNPTMADSDSDGIPDAQDSYPLIFNLR